jgi:general secretion pathway protein D
VILSRLLLSALAGLSLYAATARELYEQGRKARDLYEQGRKAEDKERFAEAYLLYSQAAAADPQNPRYWGRAQALRTRALSQSAPVLSLDAAAEVPATPDFDLVNATIPEKELAEAQPPPELEGKPDPQSFDLRGDAKTLFEQVARAYGLDVVFDGEYQPGQPARFRITDAGFRDALRSLEAATGSFIIPISSRLFMVAKDTPQKRVEVEPTMALVVPIPEPVTLQEAQELARSVQQVMEIPKYMIDSQRRLVLMRDRVSKVKSAQALLLQLMYARPQVVIEAEFLEVNKNSSLSYGLRLPARFGLAHLGRIGKNAISEIPAGFTKFFAFGGGKTLFGIGIADPELFASMTQFNAKTLLRTELRSVDGTQAAFHVGDKYPIITGTYFAGTGNDAFAAPPIFNFEDLGLVLKLTPRVHGADEVSLAIESEFKVLSGETLNGIPVISNRRFNSTVRLKTGEWAIVAGVVNSTEARTLSGIAGLSSIPILGPLTSEHGRDKNDNQVLLVLKPRIVTLPPGELGHTPEVWVGTETRPATSL